MVIAKKTGSTKAASAGVKSLTVSSGKDAKLASLIADIRKAIGKTACRACRSGIDRIVFQDRVINR